MRPEIDLQHAQNLKWLSRLSGNVVLIVGLAVLTGWRMGWSAVLGIAPGYPFMAPNTAVVLVLLGLNLLPLLPKAEKRRDFLLGTSLFVIGFSSMYESVWPKKPLWINHALANLLSPPEFIQSITQHPFPAPNTSICLILFGAALVFRPYWAQWLILFALFIPTISLLGQAFEFSNLSVPIEAIPLSGMAIHTAIGLFIAGLGYISRNPTESIFVRALARTPSAVILRTLGVAALVIPVLFGIEGTIRGLIPVYYVAYAQMALALSIIALFFSAMFFAIRSLEHSEERFGSLVENSYDSILIVGESGKIEFVNKQASASLGYTTNELIGAPIEVLIPSRFVAQHVKDRQRFMKRPAARPMGKDLDLLVRRKDGSEIPVEISLTPIKLGTRCVVTAIVRDISERKKIENQQRFLAESARILTESLDFQERLQRIADQCVPFLADFCVVFVAEGDTVKVRAVSHKDESMRGFLKETAELYPSVSVVNIGKTPESAASEFHEEVTDASLYRVAKGEEHFERLRKIGAKSYLTVHLVARSKVIGVLSMGIVNSNRRFSKNDIAFIESVALRFAMAADNARLYQEAMHAIRAREDILSIVSHDLKNPIAAIDLASQLLTLQLDANAGTKSIKELVDRIFRANKQMNRLVKELLSFGQIQAGTFTAHPSTMRLREFFEELNELFQPLAKSGSISLKFSDFGDLEFNADPDSLFQALSNLIGNALKFTPSGGAIEVTGLPGDDGDIRILVQDTGPGISPEIKEKIFERYWQPESSKKFGTGLGLFIVKGIVESHGGKVWVESETGKGACFTIQIPRSGPKPIKIIPPSEAQVSTGGPLQMNL